jgi:putative membrane protein
MEVELGKYAQQTAQNQRVKNFATMMVKDHSKANDELKALAAKKNITLPTVLDEKHMDKMNDIKEKRGADFDKEYIKEMVDDHDKDVDKFRKQAENGEDADIKAFAAKTLPVLITHQDSAKSIRDAIK